MTDRVGINLLWLLPGVVGGSEESTSATLRALRELAVPDIDVELFALPAFASAHPDLLDAFPTSVAPLTGRSRALRVVAESTWLAARTRGLALVHHAGGTAPLLRGAPYVLTVHDLQPLEQRATHGRVKRAYLGAVLPRSVRHARAVIVPSHFVRRSLLERTGADPAAVHVVHHGVSTWDATPPEVVRERYRLEGQVVLYPAITYPHKNHGVLVDAFALVARDHPDATLVLSGGAGGSESAVSDQVDRLGLADRVRRTARISAPDLAGLYRLASLVAVPSCYEGFGLPAAEAMAFGAPLVAADATALPEVVGDAGLLIAPDDVDGWASALDRLLRDPAERARLAAAGRARAAAFTWRANAEGVLSAYRAALG